VSLTKPGRSSARLISAGNSSRLSRLLRSKLTTGARHAGKLFLTRKWLKMPRALIILEDSDYEQLRVFVEEHGRYYLPALTKLLDDFEFWKEDENEDLAR
jgi:hypothetical protein